MKTLNITLKSLYTSTSAQILFRTYITPILFALVTLSSCSKDDEDFSADVAKIVGTYSVTDTFGDIMYVPVKATIKGNTFHVPAQTFKGKSMTIIITGQGILNGSQLTFDYTIETSNSLLEHSCVASKSV
jgi:hypothetical protein